MTRDPVCGREVDPLRARAVGIFGGRFVYFCSPEHKSAYSADPSAHAAHAGSGGPAGHVRADVKAAAAPVETLRERTLRSLPMVLAVGRKKPTPPVGGEASAHALESSSAPPADSVASDEGGPVSAPLSGEASQGRRSAEAAQALARTDSGAAADDGDDGSASLRRGPRAGLVLRVVVATAALALVVFAAYYAAR
jgi:YHS domain-containing protein